MNKGQIGLTQLVLVEGHSKRSQLDLVGRNDFNTKVVFPDVSIQTNRLELDIMKRIKPGDYVAVEIIDANSQTLTGRPFYLSSVSDFHSNFH